MKCVHLAPKAVDQTTGLQNVTTLAVVMVLRDVSALAVVMDLQDVTAQVVAMDLQDVMVQVVAMDLQDVTVQVVAMDLRDLARVLKAEVQGDHQTLSDLLSMLCILMLTEMESSTRQN